MSKDPATPKYVIYLHRAGPECLARLRDYLLTMFCIKKQ